jgi:hypothetical protein
MTKAKWYRAVAILVSLTMPPICSAGTKSFQSQEEVNLPPVEQRQIIGTWITSSLSGICTRSFESVGQKVYSVLRCDDGSGGKSGKELTKVSKEKFISRSSTHGDHYVILANGNLSIRDRDGEVDVESKHADLWPTTKNKVSNLAKIEDAKTVGLKCYDVGFRYGHTATSSMKGKKINPAWDFATPERCRNDPDTDKGIQAGTRAAW